MKNTIWRRSLLSAAFLIAGTPALAQLSLDDFTPPVQGGDTQPSGEVARSGSDVQAETMQDGLGFAYQAMQDSGNDRVTRVNTKTGHGVISRASAQYSVYENPNATLLSKRSAYNRAYMQAGQQLIGHFEGESLDCNNAVVEQMIAIDTGRDSAANTSLSEEEACATVVQGLLSSYVVYAVDDDTDGKTVSVAIASSTKTRSAFERVSGGVAKAEDVNAAFNQVMEELSLGVLPPVGAKLITGPNDEVVILGFGGAVVRQNRDARIEDRLREAARRQADTRAKRAIVSFLNGDEMLWQNGYNDSTMEMGQQFDLPVDEEGAVAGDPQLLDETRGSFLSVYESSTEYQSSTSGQLPAGVQLKSMASPDGNWQYSIAVFMPAMTLQAERDGAQNRAAAGAFERNRPHDDMREGSDGQVGDNKSRGMRLEGGHQQDGANTRGPSGRVIRDNDF